MPFRTHTRWTGHSRWSDKTWPTGGQFLSMRTPWTVWKHKKIWHQKMSPPRSEDVPYATGEEQRAISKASRKKEEAGPKQKWRSVVDTSCGKSKVWFYEQYCIGTWTVRSMNQGKLNNGQAGDGRVNINILGISELKWIRMSEFNSDDHYIYYCGKESLRRNGVAHFIKRVQQKSQQKSPKCSSWVQSQK